MIDIITVPPSILMITFNATETKLLSAERYQPYSTFFRSIFAIRQNLAVADYIEATRALMEQMIRQGLPHGRLLQEYLDTVTESTEMFGRWGGFTLT